MAQLHQQRYSCFLHSGRWSYSITDACADCGRQFDYWLRHAPTAINGRTVVAPIDRGFYSAVFKTQHPRLRDRFFATKVMPKIPCDTPRSAGGFEKDVAAEVQLHSSFAEVRATIQVADWGTETLTFEAVAIPCYWIETEFVDGPTLDDLIAAGPDDPLDVAQIAVDLLEFLEEFDQRGAYHNDLHGKNIKVITIKSPKDARRDAVRPLLMTRFLDLGSAGLRSKSIVDGRPGDIHRVATHILELVAAFERVNAGAMTPEQQYVCSKLRQVAQLYCSQDRYRNAKPRDLRNMVLDAVRYRGRWWEKRVRLATLDASHNAASMDSSTAQQLCYDPENWRRELLKPGPLILTGMRGCGKTMLLRTVHWEARTYQAPSEKLKDVESRLRSDTWIGLFVSCATLLRGPKPAAQSRPIERLLLAFALEAVRFVQSCQLRLLGTIQYEELVAFDQTVARLIDWYKSPLDPADPFALETSLLRACNAVPTTADGDVNARDMFEAFTSAFRRTVDLLAAKQLLFLLDDVSRRYLARDSVDELLSHLCFQSEEFSFKISSETQTLQLHTPSGSAAHPERDYTVFDLGDKVFERLRSDTSVDFIDEVLFRRSQVTDGAPAERPKEVLGRRLLIDISTDIRSGEKHVYGGIDGLAGVCVGDIGDVLHVYKSIIEAHGTNALPVPIDIQHAAMSEFSERLLRALAVEDAWLHSHAIAFAQAANRELIQSDDTRLREYSEVFVKMQPSAQKRVFEQLWALVDRGVFVATGATPRTKIPGTESYVLFKLAYRKMFGLTSKVPLGMRDRFEISGPRLSRWLSKPTGDSLMPRRRKQRKKPSRRLPDPEAAKPQSRRRSGKAYVLKGLLDLRPNRTPEPVAGSGPVEDGGIKPALLYDTEIEQARLAGKAQIAIANMWIVAAAGFEDRSIGAWENLLRVGKPAGVTLLCYHGNRRLNRTNEGRILALLRQASIPHIQCQSAEIATEEVVALTTQRAGGQDVAVDVTSLSKPLIFSLAREFVRRRDRLTVLHTSAQTYYPRDAQLRPVVQLLGQGAYRDAFDALERAVVGERGPYGLIPVGRSLSDPSRPVFLALFVSLKFDPVDALIKGGEPESLIAYYPVHSRGEKGVRSIVAKYLGEHVADTHGGSCKSIPSMGAREAYSELRKSYEEFALNRSHNFEIGLAGTKMHAVGAAMFASIAPVSAVWYARPSRFDRRWFTEGTGRTVAYRIRRLIRDQPQTT